MDLQNIGLICLNHLENISESTPRYWRSIVDSMTGLTIRAETLDLNQLDQLATSDQFR